MHHLPCTVRPKIKSHPLWPLTKCVPLSRDYCYYSGEGTSIIIFFVDQRLSERGTFVSKLGQYLMCWLRYWPPPTPAPLTAHEGRHAVLAFSPPIPYSTTFCRSTRLLQIQLIHVPLNQRSHVVYGSHDWVVGKPTLWMLPHEDDHCPAPMQSQAIQPVASGSNVVYTIPWRATASIVPKTKSSCVEPCMLMPPHTISFDRNCLLNRGLWVPPGAQADFCESWKTKHFP